MADATHLRAIPRDPAHPEPGRYHADPAVDRAVAAFLDRYDNVRTTEVYAIHLAVLCDWMTQQGLHPFKAHRTDLEAFMRHLTRERGNRPSSVAQRMTIVRHWYDLLLDDELVTRNPCRMLRLPKQHPDPKRLIGMSLTEFTRLEETARARGPERWALVVLMGRLGLRASEAIAVDIEDFHERHVAGHYVLDVIGKGAKPATIPLTVPVLRALEAARGDRTSGPLLRTRSGARLDRRGALRWMHTLGKAAGIEHVTCHALRRAYVTLSLAAGADVYEVQRGARHASINTTIRYQVARNVLDRHVNHTLSAYLSAAG